MTEITTGSPKPTGILIIVKLFILTEEKFKSNFEMVNHIIYQQNQSENMKRLIIFAAMLLTLSLSSTAADDEPSVRRNPEEIVLIGKTVITPQRSIVYCEFVFDPETCIIDISCFGTGITEFKITDSYGSEVDRVTVKTWWRSYA